MYSIYRVKRTYQIFSYVITGLGLLLISLPLSAYLLLTYEDKESLLGLIVLSWLFGLPILLIPVSIWTTKLKVSASGIEFRQLFFLSVKTDWENVETINLYGSGALLLIYRLSQPTGMENLIFRTEIKGIGVIPLTNFVEDTSNFQNSKLGQEIVRYLPQVPPPD